MQKKKENKCTIYTLRSIIEQVLEVEKDLYLCLIDHIMAFDRVGHEKIITQITQLRIDGQDLGMIKNVYWEQTE